MNKKFIFGILTVLFSLYSITITAFGSELNERLKNCTPTKSINGGSSTTYQISGLRGSICVFKILNSGFTNKPDLICKVPYTKMSDMTSINPLTVQTIKNQYCIMTIKSLNKQKRVYY